MAFGRAAVAGAARRAYLWPCARRGRARAQARRLAVVAVGVIVGFPLFTSLALVTSDAAHGAVVIAVLPAATALAAVAARRRAARPGVLARRRSPASRSCSPSCSRRPSGALTAADAFLLVGTALCALGYAEGGALARELGGARTISWALVLSLPLTIPVTLVAVDAACRRTPTRRLARASATRRGRLMFLGFFAWYAGLARGGVARVGQVQLTQPLLTFVWAALVLGEHAHAR